MASIYRSFKNFDLSGKRVLLRADMNVPMRDGVIRDTMRIEKIIPTINEIIKRGAGIVLLSHLGRPQGRFVSNLSLKPLLPVLQNFLPNIKVNFSEDGACGTQIGEVLLLENLRFNPGEESNDIEFAKALSKLGDLYVNDAFSCSHRAHGSIEAISHLLPSSAGLLMQKELDALNNGLDKPSHPVAAVVGGNKISTKLGVLKNLISKVDHLIVGGAMANTFLYAKGIKVGKSLVEDNMVDIARDIEHMVDSIGCFLHLPIDAIVAPQLENGSKSTIETINSISDQQMILDIGPDTITHIIGIIKTCRTLLWNGPLGAFEYSPFDGGTNAVAQAAADLTLKGSLLSVAGGGDTMSALSNAGVQESFSYISSAGGAFLEWLEGRTLPGIANLMD